MNSLTSVTVLFTNSAQFLTIKYKTIFCTEEDGKILVLKGEISNYANMFLNCKKVEIISERCEKTILENSYVFYNKEEATFCILSL